MGKEIVEVVQSTDPQVVAAVIGAAAGLASGALVSLVSPVVNHFLEQRNKSIEQKRQRILEIRALLDSCSSLSEVKKSSHWGFIEANLSEEEAHALSPTTLHCIDRSGALSDDDIRKQFISKMVSRLEKEWFK